MSVLIVLLGLLRIFRCASSHDYVVTNDQLTAVDGESETLIDFNNLAVIGRERFINGSIKFLVDMDDENFSFTVAMYNSPNGDGNYKKMAMEVPKTQICKGFNKLYKEFIQPSFTYGENSNMPYIDDDGLCPIPAGEYYFKNIEFNTDDWPNQMSRGTVKFAVTFYKGDDAIGGLIISLKVEDDTR